MSQAPRLGALLRQLDGTPEQVAELLSSRAGAATVDVHALLRGGAAASAAQ